MSSEFKYKKIYPSEIGLFHLFFLLKINKNGIKLWEEQHLLDDEVANEKYEVTLRLQQRNEEIQSCSLQNTEHEGHLQGKNGEMSCTKTIKKQGWQSKK